MSIAIGSDHGGYILKGKVKAFLQELGISYEDYGTYSKESVDYPDYALKVCKSITSGTHPQGILICGTGIGMSIASNKIKGIRCAVVSDEYSARMSREHNDANVLAIGERVIGEDLAKSIVKAFLEGEFKGSRHNERLEKICNIEGNCFG